MGKAVAASVVAMMSGREPLPPSLANTCYSMVNEREAIYVTGVFEFDARTKKMAGVKAAGGVRSLDRLLEVRALGVTRVGASRTEQILDDARARLGLAPIAR